jgi:predicted dehydrogenase
VLPAILRAGHSIVAIAGRDPGRLAEFQSQFGIACAYSWKAADRLLEHSSMDAVYIPLPNSMHAEWTMRALHAGKHVLCEKPMALTVAEADLVISAAADNNCVLMENFSYQFAPAFQYLAKLQTPLKVVSLSHSFQATEEHRLRYNHALGGGSFLDLGCYCVDLVHRLFDSAITIDRVRATAPAPGRRAWGLVDEMCGLSGRTSSGIAISIESSFSEFAAQDAILDFVDPSQPKRSIRRIFRADPANPAEISSLDAGSPPLQTFEPFDTEVALLNAFAEMTAAPATNPADTLRWRRNASVLEQVQSRIAEQLGIHAR